jgi:ribonuclease HI
LEQRYPFFTLPWWEPPKTNIATSAEAARAIDDQILQQNSGLTIYTDGSAINGKVGASAVQHGLSITRQTFVGRTPEANVFLAEMVGIRMGLEMAQQRIEREVIIFCDSQAAIQAIDGSQKTNQQILGSIAEKWDELRSQSVQVTIHWIPAHQGIEGNERADRAAKEATGWRLVRNSRGRQIPVDRDSTAPRLVGLQQPLSALKRDLKTLAYNQWEQNWQQTQRGRSLFRIADKPSKKNIELHAKLSRPLSSILTQMRAGNISLRYFLYKRNIPGIDDGECQCRRGAQTVTNILLSCPRFKEERNSWKNEGTWSSDVRKILSDWKIRR